MVKKTEPTVKRRKWDEGDLLVYQRTALSLLMSSYASAISADLTFIKLPVMKVHLPMIKQFSTVSSSSQNENQVEGSPFVTVKELKCKGTTNKNFLDMQKKMILMFFDHNTTQKS